MKIIIANTNLQALLSTTYRILNQYDRDDIPEKLKGQATLSALKSTFESNHFSVCTLQNLAKLNDIQIDSETLDYFNTLHCVNFSDMTIETRAFLFAKCFNLFRSNIVMSNTAPSVSHEILKLK